MGSPRTRAASRSNPPASWVSVGPVPAVALSGLIKRAFARVFTLAACAWMPLGAWADSGATMLRFEHFFGSGSPQRITLQLLATGDPVPWGLEIPVHATRSGRAAALKDRPRDIAFGFLLGAAALGVAYMVVKETEESSRVEVRGGFRAEDPAAGQSIGN